MNTNNVLNFEVRTLDNGLTCIYVPMDTPGSACSNIVYNIGSANEKAGEYGLAHLLEHGMHFGSPKYNSNTPGGLITDMELKAGIENATTSFYRTNYFLTVPVHYIPDVLLREADRMSGLDTKIFCQRLVKECTVVENEMEIGQTNPMRMMMNHLYKIAFNTQPNGHSTIGLKKHLEAAVADQGKTLLAFHKRSYTPDNATLVLAGPFNSNTITVNDLHGKVEAAFGQIQSGCLDHNNYEEESQQKGMRTFTIPGDATMCAIGFRGPPGIHKDSIALTALARCLKYRLQDLENHNICMQTEVMWDRSKQSSLFTIWTVGFQDPDLVRNSVQKIIEGTQGHNTITAQELSRAKEELSTAWAAELQSAQGVADAFTEAVAMGYPNDVNIKFHALDGLRPRDLTVASKNWLIETGSTIGLMFPYEVKNQNMSHTQAPALTSVGTNHVGNVLLPPSMVSHLRFGDMQHFSSGDPGSSMVTSGTFWKRPGMVHVSATFTPNVDVEWFSLAMGNLVKNPHVSWQQTGPGSVMMTLMCPPEKLQSALDHVWGDSKEYSNAGERGHMIQQGLSCDINKYANKLMTEALFNIPKYKHSMKQAVELVKQSPRRVVAVAPDNDTLNILRDHFKHNEKYKEFVPEPNNKPKSVAVQQGKTSIKVLFGQAIPKLSRQHKDYIPLNIASAILGYGFHGMLMTRVRITDGLTYGISSYISPGSFNVGATFPPRNLERGVRDIKSVLAQWRGGITHKEVDIQKQRLKLMPITLSDSAAMYVKAQHTFLNEKDIDKCSHKDVLAAFDRHIDIQNLTEVRVG